MSGSSESVAQVISEVSVEAECRWLGVTYKAPGEAEEIDLAGQNVPRGMAACKLRRGRMAKKCHTAAKKRGTTREAALTLRLAEDERAAMGAQLQPITVRLWWQTAVAPSGVPSIAPAPPTSV